jgi:hypothetical protein
MNTERMRNLAELKKLVKIKRESLDKISKFLVGKGVAKEFAEKLAMDCLKEDLGMRALPTFLEKLLDVDLSDPTKGQTLFVGPMGCGASLFLEGDKMNCVELTLFDEEGLQELGREYGHYSDIHIHLVLPAYMKEEDMYSSLHQFSALPLTHLAFTKMDESLSLGSLIQVQKRSCLPIRYMADSKAVYKGCARQFVKLLLTHTNEKEFQLMRSIAQGGL